MQIVIVGAGYAGLSCALRLARKTRGRAQITLINGREQFVERIRLHEQAAGTQPRALGLSALLQGTGVELAVGWVSQIDLSAKTLQVGERKLSWDRLVLALGSDSDRSRVAGVRDHAYTLSADQLPALSSTLRSLAGRAGRVVVVGGGLTGIEAASELAEAYPHLQVSLLTRGGLAPDVSPGAQRHMRRVLSELGVHVEEHTEVLRVEAERVLTPARAIPCDVCIWAAGFVAPALARDAGLWVNGLGQVWVDDRLRAPEHPDVYVIGDLAKLRGAAGEALPLGCKLALPMGLYLADSFARSLDTEDATDAFTFRPPLYCVSLGRSEALVQTLPISAKGARHFGGWLAVRIKEWICLGTLLMLRWERQRAAWSAGFWGRGRRALPKTPAAEHATERLHV